MQRPIKFRAYHKSTGKMFYFNRPWVCTEYSSLSFEAMGYPDHYVLLAGHSALPSNNYEDYELMQYTGLHDKNGKEVYAGDIVRCVVGSGGDGEEPKSLQGVVNYDDGIHLRINQYGAWFCHSYEVIGNKWENPELLEAK